MDSFLKAVTNCDERIASVKETLDSLILKEKIFGLGKHHDKIQMLENNIQIIKLEKLVYISIINPKTSAIFSKLLSKYDVLVSQAIELHRDLVIHGKFSEGDHLEFCSDVMEQRKFVKIVCDYGNSVNE